MFVVLPCETAVQSNGFLEVLKTGCSLKDCIEHATNLKYEKEKFSCKEHET